MHAHIFIGLLEHVKTGGLGFGVRGADCLVDLALVLFEEWVDVLLVKHDGALFPWSDEVEVYAEADPGVEGNPGEDEVELRFNREEEREGRPVHEPWCEEGGIASADGFVGGENGEEDRCHRARDRISVVCVVLLSVMWHEREDVCYEAKHVGGLVWYEDGRGSVRRFCLGDRPDLCMGTAVDKYVSPVSSKDQAARFKKRASNVSRELQTDPFEHGPRLVTSLVGLKRPCRDPVNGLCIVVHFTSSSVAEYRLLVTKCSHVE